MNPSLSIITISFENPNDLERTCQSVSQVISSSIEHLIVDGSRDERCRDVALRYPQSRYLGGKDRGKYDAMNKGASASLASAIIFINSGDEIADSDVIKNLVLMHAHKLPDTLFYGDCLKRLGTQVFYEHAPEINDQGLRIGKLPSHQSIIIPTQYQRDNPYDVELDFAADTKFLKQAFKNLPGYRIKAPIGIFEYGGISSAAGSISSIKRQFCELVVVHELTTSEMISVALLLVRRKLLATFLGSHGLLNAQARRLARTCDSYPSP